MSNRLSQQQGFTLIELLIVVSLSVLLMLTASSLFLTLLIGNTKTNSATLIKQEGNAALQQIDFLFRNAVDLEPNSLSQTCNATMNDIVIKSFDGGTTWLRAEQDSSDGKYKIASNSGVFLTSGAVDLVGDTISISCVQSADLLTKYITLSFTLRKGIPGVDQARDIVEQTFSLSTNLRSF